MKDQEDFEPESTQECVACHIRKPLQDFDFDGQTENGRRYRCIECDDNQQPLLTCVRCGSRRADMQALGLCAFCPYRSTAINAVPDEAKNLDELLAEDAADEEE